MKRLLLLSSLLSLLAAQPVWAGHGFIEERDDCFYVEYTGDPGEKPADVGKVTVASSAATYRPTRQEVARQEANQRQAEISQAEREARREARSELSRPDGGRIGSRSWRKNQQSQPGANPE